MAYSKKETYRTENARKSNSKRFPNGYLYILAIKEHDLYKVGVSQKPKRRIRDIKGVLPYDSEVIFLRHYKNVYNLEKLVHKTLSINQKKKEWFQLHEEDVNGLKKILEEIFLNENK